MGAYRGGFVASSGLVRAQGKVLCLSIGWDNQAQYMGRGGIHGIAICQKVRIM